MTLAGSQSSPSLSLFSVQHVFLRGARQGTQADRLEFFHADSCVVFPVLWVVRTPVVGTTVDEEEGVWGFFFVTPLKKIASGASVGALLPFALSSPTTQGIEEEDLYLSNFLVALSNLPGNLASAWLVEVIGRKWTLVSSMAVA